MRKYLLLLGFLVGATGLGGIGWLWYSTTRPEYRLRAGQSLIKEGDLEAAERYALLLQANGDRDHCLLLQGEIALEKKQFEHALVTLNQIRDKGDLRLEALALVGRAHLDLGRLLNAERAFGTLLLHRKDHLDAHRGLSAVYFNLGALTRAVHHCQEWARLDSKDGRPCRFMGLIYNKDLDKKEEAVSAYQEALKRDLKPEVHEEVRLELAECLVHLKEYAKALEALKASDPPPKLNPKLLFLRGECLRALNRTAEAWEQVEQLRKIDANYADGLRLRAQLHADAGELEPAVELLEKAVALDAHDFTSRYQLGQVYTRLGRGADAQEQTRRVKETQGLLDDLTKLGHAVLESPHDAKLHRRMAEVYDKLSWPEMAARKRRIAAMVEAATPPSAPPYPSRDR
jgi:tetratricopeptide (TPR) repeat protein